MNIESGITIEVQSSTTGWTRLSRKAAVEDKAQKLGGFGEEQKMAKDKVESFETEIFRVAALLGEGDEGLNKEELRWALESAGIDPALFVTRFHEAVARLGEDLRREGRTVPLSVQEAIATTELSAAPSRRAQPKHGRPSR